MTTSRCISIIVLAIALLAVDPASAQALAAAKATNTPAFTPPRTPDGVPDLQGVWTNASAVPLERPKGLGAKEFYTDEEAAQREKQSQDQAERAVGGRQTEPGTVADVHYDLGQYGLSRSQSKTAESKRTSLIVGPEGQVPPLLPEAQKRQAERAAANRGHQWDGPENRGLSERCILWPNEGPPMLPVGYNGNLQIAQGPGYVAIMQEMIHDVRIIPTDGRPHAPQSIRQWMGDSRGHWEGNTLVVDTTNFSNKTAFRGSSDKLHVIERFTRANDDTILYQFTVEDPTTWAKPWSAEILITKSAGPVFEYACQEGNYGMANILSGARATERKAAEEVAAKK
ncbi:MAG TPA: hypothetical protein VG096_00320 [Bryobacteraceae bacterium]|jgi:hypothetical protein|nr:hypothetical protein [Bryobacteraceae bacterium]